MTRTKTRQDLGQVAIRLAAQAIGLTIIAACTATGYLIYDLTSESGGNLGMGGIFAGLGDAVGELLGPDPRVALVILPGLIVGGLSLAGIYFWNKRGG